MVLYRMHLAGRSREHLHRERLAMIEKGLVPSPESDPQQFERMMDWHPSRTFEPRARNSRRTGIIVLAVGLGLSVQGYFGRGNAGATAGVLLIFIGLAFLAVAMFEAQPPHDQPPRTPTDIPKP
jgi:hypothetical protein